VLAAALHDLDRLRGISTVLARHGFDRLAESIRTGMRGRVGQIDNAPRRLRLLLQDLGPTYVKLGQVLSTRPDILPSAYIKELRTLQDASSPIALEAVTKAVEGALGAAVGELFARFEESPLATGSIAQVHRAALADGRQVVVKVQRPGIEQTIRSDVDLLYVLARVIEATVEESAMYAPVRIVQEFERAIFQELDFVHELKNVEDLRRNFGDGSPVVFPKCVEELCARTVLVMEYVEGEKLSTFDAASPLAEKVVKSLLDGYFQMVYTDGLFHGDPHPGNVLVLPDGRVALLDMGLVGRLSRRLQDSLVQVSIAVAMKDADSTARIIHQIGSPAERVSILKFRDDIDALYSRYLGGTLEEVDAGGLLAEILDLAIRYKIRIPADTALLAKVCITLEGLVRALRPGTQVGTAMAPYARRLLVGRFGPATLGKAAMKGAMGLMGTLEDMPLRLHQIVSDLETGRMSVRVTNDEMDKLSRTLNDFGSKVFLGLVACALIIGSCFWLVRYPMEVRGVPVAPILGLAAAGLIMTFVFWWHVLYRRIRKVRLAWWLAALRWGRKKDD